MFIVQRSPSWRLIATLLLGTAAVAGCGGGGSTDNVASALPAPSSTPKATAVTPANGKTAWNLSAGAKFALSDASGAAVTGALTCVSDTPVAMEVAADCSSVKGLRLGSQIVTVSAGGISAKASLKVIPQPHPIGTNGYTQNSNLVVTPDGRVLAWGANSREGILGQGKRGSELASVSLPSAVKSPSGQGVLSGIVAASSGGYSALALTEDGEVYSWGNPGALGRVANNGDPLPAKVLDATGNATLQRIVSVSVGDGNAVALADDGTVFSWGSFSAQPGADPANVPGVVPLPGKAVAVSAGFQWTAALLADGRVMTWGFGSSSGNLGQGSVSVSAEVPGFVIDKANKQPISDITSISAGFIHGLALTSTGQIYAWGHNAWGELGQNDDKINGRPGEPTAVFVKAPGSEVVAWSGVKMVAAGGSHSLALDGSGKVFSWGYSQRGELADGANHPRVNSSASPAPAVNAAGIGQLSDIVSLGVGYSHSLALSSDGSLLVWGYDGGVGNLGQGTTPVVAKDFGALSYVPLTVKNESGTAALVLGPIGYWPNLIRRAIF